MVDFKLRHKRIVGYDGHMNDLLEYQVYLPDDCLNDMYDIVETWKKKLSGWTWERNFIEMTMPMIAPLSEEYALLTIDVMSGRNPRLLMKLAANPSISDYALMELQVKCPECAIDDVNEIIEKRKPARDEYRRMHA